ncbi:MAG: ABC transporter permease subunit [Caldiserica bacterium]|nr:ABC transporter permease subunit [Caldisericota bacterium]
MKALMWKELRENRLKIIIGCVLLMLIGLAVSIAYRFLEGGIPGMGQIPPEYADLIKKLMPDFSNVNAYLYSQWFSKNLQQVGAVLAVILLSSAVAGERELHTAIFLFSRPVSRGMILASKIIVLFAGLVLAVLVSTGAAVLGAVIVGKVPQAAFVLTATLHCVIALLDFASLATLLSVLVPDRMKAMLFTGGIIIVLSVAGQFKPLHWLNPLALFGNSTLVGRPVPQLVPIAVGVALSACMLWISYRVLQRQEF